MFKTIGRLSMPIYYFSRALRNFLTNAGVHGRMNDAFACSM